MKEKLLTFENDDIRPSCRFALTFELHVLFLLHALMNFIIHDVLVGH